MDKTLYYYEIRVRYLTEYPLSPLACLSGIVGDGIEGSGALDWDIISGKAISNQEEGAALCEQLSCDPEFFYYKEE